MTNFEPNYLAFIEFYDEDFLWRYTPARANDARLRPWLALLVLEEGATPDASEFTRNERRLPLPSVTVQDRSGVAAAPTDLGLGARAHNEGYDASRRSSSSSCCRCTTWIIRTPTRSSAG